MQGPRQSGLSSQHCRSQLNLLWPRGFQMEKKMPAKQNREEKNGNVGLNFFEMLDIEQQQREELEKEKEKIERNNNKIFNKKKL